MSASPRGLSPFPSFLFLHSWGPIYPQGHNYESVLQHSISGSGPLTPQSLISSVLLLNISVSLLSHSSFQSCRLRPSALFTPFQFLNSLSDDSSSSFIKNPFWFFLHSISGTSPFLSTPNLLQPLTAGSCDHRLVDFQWLFSVWLAVCSRESPWLLGVLSPGLWAVLPALGFLPAQSRFRADICLLVVCPHLRSGGKFVTCICLFVWLVFLVNVIYGFGFCYIVALFFLMWEFGKIQKPCHCHPQLPKIYNELWNMLRT